MKLKLLISLLVCYNGFAQTILTNSLDKETGNKTIITNNHTSTELTTDDSIVRDGLIFFSAGYQKINTSGTEIYFVEVNIVHKDNRLGCLKIGESKIILYLEDGTSIECSQISETDCDPIGFTSAFALMPRKGTMEMMMQNFDKLMKTKIKSIKVITTESSPIFTVKSAAKLYIMNHFVLLDKTIKAS